MELRQLEAFVAVAELRSFTKAAQRLSVVQSGVSATVAGLEHELAAALFHREPRGVRLTVAGEALLPEARATLDAARAAREAVAQVAGGVSGQVHLGTLASIDAVDLPALLARLRDNYPGVRVRLSTAASGSAGLTAALADGSLDLALIGTDGAPLPGLRQIRLLTVPLVALLPGDHPLAARRAVSLGELAPEPFIDFPPGFGNRRIVDAEFARLSLRRSVALEVTDTTLAARYVRHGLGVSLVPSLVAPGEQDDVVVRPLTPSLDWTLSVAIATTRRPSPAAKALLDLIPQFVAPGRDGRLRP
jgi:DNA-binding transcriptional LysR family regulator